MSRRLYQSATSLLLASVVACAGAPEKSDATHIADEQSVTSEVAAEPDAEAAAEGSLAADRDQRFAADDDVAEAAPKDAKPAPVTLAREKASEPLPATPSGGVTRGDMAGAGGLLGVVGTGRAEAKKREARQGPGRAHSMAAVDGLQQAPAQGLIGGNASTPPPPPAEPVVEPEQQDKGGTFVHAGVNPLTDTREDNLSTFAVDVDTASYTYARRFMQSGQRPSEGSVRVEEWVNAFHYEYDGPKSKLPFAVHLAAAPSPFVKGRHIVRVGVQGKRLAKHERKPVHLTFLVDVSGSMMSYDKLPLAQRSLHLLTNELRDDDSVAIVTYAGNTGEVLPATKATRDGKRRIHEAIERLQSGGGTNMSSGMELAYKNAHRFLSSGSESRVIVLSDGDANIGHTSHQDMLKRIAGYVSEGVTMSTIGFGTGNYRDHLMEQLANAGNGNYSYIDSEKAAKKAFVDDLTGTLQVIAQDVKIQVEMNPDRVAAYRLIGYENRDVADKDFRNDRVDAGEIGAGHTVTALYEVVLRDGDNATDFGDIATVRIRHKTPRGVKATEIARTLTGAHVQKSFDSLDADTRFAAAAALSAEILRGSEHVAHLELEDARLIAEKAAVGRYADERKELVSLLSKVIQSRPALSRR